MARTRDPALEEARLAAIARAATDLLVEGAWHGATLERVAERAGMSKGALAYWFPSKNELLLGVLRRHHADYETRLLAIAADPAPVRERLRRVVEAAFPDREQVAREVRFQIELWSAAKENEQVAREVLDAYRQFRLACGALIGMAIAEGAVRTDDPEGLALQIQALVDGMSLHIAFDASLDFDRERASLQRRLESWLFAA